MSEKKVHEPAFPYGSDVAHSGMALRDYWAAHAPPVPEWFEPIRWIADVVVDYGTHSAGNQFRPEKRERQEAPLDLLTRWSFAYADAMLKARGEA